jgi:hypothetical protein
LRQNKPAGENHSASALPHVTFKFVDRRGLHPSHEWRYDRGCSRCGGFDAIGGADHALRGAAFTTIAAVNITATVTVAKMKPTSFKPFRSVIVIRHPRRIVCA